MLRLKAAAFVADDWRNVRICRCPRTLRGAHQDGDQRTMWPMCQDCPTTKTRAKGVGRELLADFLLPFIIYGIVIGSLIVTGTWTPF